MADRVLIYGAYGYTGALVAGQAVKMGMEPVLAGRDPSRLQPLADKLGLDAVTFKVTDEDAVRRTLEPFSVLLNCAGPFVRTWRAMTRACLQTKTHYLDITGELEVIEGCAELDGAARTGGITIMPGVGFDVVPTDCMAAMLVKRLPDASSLTLAFKGMGQASRGTATTAAAYLGDRPIVRRDNKLEARTGNPFAQIDFGEGPERVVATTWGDVVTAWHTTGVPTIEVFLQPPADMANLLKLPMFVRRFLASSLGRPLVDAQLRKMPAGPDEHARAVGRCVIYGRAENPEGDRVERRLTTVEGYRLTSITAATIARIALAGGLPPGFQTPAGALGAEFILSIEGSAMLGEQASHGPLPVLRTQS